MSDDRKRRYASLTVSRFDGKTTITWLDRPGGQPVDLGLTQGDEAHWARDDQSYGGKYDLFAAISGIHSELLR